MGFLQQRMAEAIPCRGLNPSEWMKWQPVSRPRRRTALVAGGAGQWKMVIRDMAAPAKGRRDMAPNGDARPSWGGMKGRWVARRGLPAVVEQREVSDDLAPFQIEAAEVRQNLEAAPLAHRADLAGVVEAHHRGQEHALAAAQHTQGVVEHQHVGPQVPLGGGTLQTFACAVAEPLVAGDFGAALPCLEERFGRLGKMQILQSDQVEYVLGQGLVHEESPGERVSRLKPLLPVACLQGMAGGLVRTEVLDGLTRDRTFCIGGADVVAGGAVADLQGQALADVDQGQMADGIGTGLCGAGKHRWGRTGHGNLLAKVGGHIPNGSGNLPVDGTKQASAPRGRASAVVDAKRTGRVARRSSAAA